MYHITWHHESFNNCSVKQGIVNLWMTCSLCDHYSILCPLPLASIFTADQYIITGVPVYISSCDQYFNDFCDHYLL